MSVGARRRPRFDRLYTILAFAGWAAGVLSWLAVALVVVSSGTKALGSGVPVLGSGAVCFWVGWRMRYRRDERRAAMDRQG